ncbi:MAG: gamma carbonic anhydrase family protein [Geminicoccaceae bacterium]
MLYELDGRAPKVASGSWVAPTAILIGDVVIEPGASVWWGAVLRGDNEPLTVGEGSNVQDNCVLHSDPGFPLTIEAEVTVGHLAMVHGCTVRRGSLVGIGATILNGAEIGEGSLIGAHSLIGEGKTIPPRSLVMGTPGKIIRELGDDHVERIRAAAERYRRKIPISRDRLRRIED